MENIKLSRYTLLMMAGCIFLMTAAYLIFLAASWNSMQQDRARRDEMMDEFLDRLPGKAEPVPTTKVQASGSEMQRMRSANAATDQNSHQIQRPPSPVLRPVHEQAPDNAPLGDQNLPD